MNLRNKVATGGRRLCGKRKGRATRENEKTLRQKRDGLANGKKKKSTKVE